MVIHEVLDAGDNILVAQELLKNSLETLVKYADNDYRVQFKHHLLIANTLSEVIGKLDIVTENDELSFTPDKLRSEEHTSELQSRFDLVCRLLLEKKKKN